MIPGSNLFTQVVASNDWSWQHRNRLKEKSIWKWKQTMYSGLDFLWLVPSFYHQPNWNRWMVTHYSSDVYLFSILKHVTCTCHLTTEGRPSVYTQILWKYWMEFHETYTYTFIISLCFFYFAFPYELFF